MSIEHRDSDEAEFRNDDLMRLARSMMDVTYGRPVPPPRLTVEQLIAMAVMEERWTNRPTSRWWRQGAPALVAAAVVAVLVVAAVLGDHSTPIQPQGNLPTATSCHPRPLRLPDAAHPPAAGPALRDLAARVRTSHDQPSPGSYTYIHVRTWSADTTTTPTSGVCRDEQVWWSADRAGREEIRTLAGLTANPVPHGDSTVTIHGPGGLAVVVESPSADPAILASQLADQEDFSSGPQAPLRAVRDLYRFHDLDAAHRSAALRVLAETPGISYRGIVVDDLGRVGVALSVDSDDGATLDVAVFDPTNGQLLAYQRVALRSPPRSALVTPTVLDAVLYLASGHRSSLTDAIGSPDPTPSIDANPPIAP